MTSLPDSSLEAGLAALKKGNYPTAIAHLENVCEIELDPATIVRAQMGLVIAYVRNGNIQKAIALCQQLNQSANPQVKQWAVRTLAEFAERYPETGRGHQGQKSKGEAPTSEFPNTGFVPFDPTAQTPQTPSEQKLSSSAPSSPKIFQSDATGFTPLDPLPPQTQTPTLGAGNQGRTVGAGSPDSLSAKQTTPINPPSSKDRVIPGTEEPKKKLTKSESLTQNSLTENLSNINVGSQKAQNKPPLQTQNFTPNPHTWRQAGRVQRWQPLPAKLGFQPDLTQLWGVQVVTAIALFWMLRLIFQFGANTTNDLLVKLPYLEPIQALYRFYYQPTLPLLIGLAILLVLSPWLMDGLLKLFYGLKPLSEETLKSHSPEASRILQRVSRERRLPLPTLGILPTAAPIALTYGNLPATARIVVSQGLLEQLADDEIATIYAAELGHVVCWDFVLMSLGVLVAQLPYTAYWLVARWGEQWEGPILRVTSGAIASVAYGLYWLLRWPLIWLSRIRIYFSDRFATEITGNPNGLTRALLKIAIGIAKDVEQQGQTSWLLESFDLLTPLGHRQAITLGSLSPYTAFEPVLAWDNLNPYRWWLTLNNSHPLTGVRLQLLTSYARYWELETELNFNPESSPKSQNSKLLLQGAPYFGMLLGLALGGLIWSIGGVGKLARIKLLAWLLKDYWWFLAGLVLAGFSIGTLLRINSLFPDITPSTRPDELALPDLLANPSALPLDSQPIRLQGKLLGRPGISNWLGQDLILQSRAGLVKLHHISWLGPIGNLIEGSTRPSNLVNRSITATGWFRRGATPWIDIEMLRTQGGTISQSGHPVWSTILAFAAAVWGAYIILRGGF